jgi:serine/threonine-protein kinase
MTDEPRVQQLLDEIFDSERTAEEVCGACPELLPEVRRRWQQMRAVEAELNALFPTTGPNPDSATPIPVLSGGDLPRIEGYEVEAVLGLGGMGIVYRARELRLNRRVALKMLLAGGYAGSEERERFLREAEAVANLRHANIVQVHSAGDHDGRPYFTMEFVEGGSLAQRLSGTPQPARPAAALVATLAEAVHVAHQGGIVHRDLKPANILLTADGTPRIADFGLARHFDGGPALTRTGARMGTPSYMAPEQALGKPGTIGPAADTYALGAILYEMLTGRPPFRGETAAETERQVIADEPVPPARLNPQIPRDLETICLRCLHKDPQRRYATTAALAQDLHRFERHEPVAARRAGWLERAGKWVRRHPAWTALLAASLLLGVMLVGAGLWLVVHQARQKDAVEADLKAVAILQENARWQEARAALKRAQQRLGGSLALPGGGGPADLRRRLDQARRDLDLVMRLDAIRLKRATRGELVFYKAQADRDYQAAFREAGLDPFHDRPEAVAAVVRDSAVRWALVAALDNWATCVTDKRRRDWLLEAARQADTDPEGWRRRILNPAVWDDPAALARLARTVPGSQPVSLLQALGERLWAVGGDAGPLLKRVQQGHPADFWANLILGNAILQSDPVEAGGYYRAALAGRPGAAVGYCAVGDALRLRNLLGEAIDYYRKAIEIDSTYSRAFSNLGLAVQAQGRLDEAVKYYRQALRLDPDYGWAHHNLAIALRDQGRLQEAYAHYREVIRVDPQNLEINPALAGVLLRLGRGREVRDRWRHALAVNPSWPSPWMGYAELCLFLGRPEDFRRARRALLRRFGSTTLPHIAEPVGRACLLLPGTAEELRQSVALIDRAAATKGTTLPWIYRYYLFAQGLAAYRQGRFADASALMKGEASRVMGPAPRLVLAMAQHRLGKKKQARQTLAKAIMAFDWSAAQADNRDLWIVHILRRQAEALIVPNLPAFLRGDYQPRDNAERLALVGACQFQGRYHTAAHLFADAWATDSAPAEDLEADCRWRTALGDRQPIGRLEDLASACRYPAARCAALAGCGRGRDGAKLSRAERARWRRQARDWLLADLAMWDQLLRGGSRAARVRVRTLLVQWQADPDLAGIRDARATANLSAAERKECQQLWKKVRGVLHRLSIRH